MGWSSFSDLDKATAPLGQVATSLAVIITATCRVCVPSHAQMLSIVVLAILLLAAGALVSGSQSFKPRVHQMVS